MPRTISRPTSFAPAPTVHFRKHVGVASQRYPWASGEIRPADMLRAQRLAADIIHGVNPRAVVGWGVAGVGTDYSHVVNGRWNVKLDVRKLTRKDIHDGGGRNEKPAFSHRAIGTMVGAAVHELAHTKFTPMNFDLTDKQLAVFRAYEDLYVNAQILTQYYPGFTAYLADAMNWSFTPEDVRNAVVGAFKAPTYQNKKQAFHEALQGVAAVDYVAGWCNVSPAVTVPVDDGGAFFRLVENVHRISEQLGSGRVFPWETRVKAFQKIADLICEYIGEPTDEEKQEAQGKDDKRNEESKREGSGSGSGAGSSDDDGSDDEEGDDGAASGGSSKDTNDDDTDAGGESDDESPFGEPYTGGTDDDPVEPHVREGCDGNHDNDPYMPANANEQELVSHAMKEAQARHDDGVTDEIASAIGTMTGMELSYTKAEKNEFTPPDPDKDRVNRLRLVFRAKEAMRSRIVHGSPLGRLSGRRLHRAMAGAQNIFRERPELATDAGAVLLLVDGSGSMRGVNYDTAAKVSNEIVQALAGTAYKVHVWTYASIGNAEFGVRTGHGLGKDFAFPRMVDGGTPSHKAMMAAGRYMRDMYPRKNQRRIIIHFSDLFWENIGYQPGVLEQFTEVFADNQIMYCTIGIDMGGHYTEMQNGQRETFPEMKVSVHTAMSAPEAIADMIADKL